MNREVIPPWLKELYSHARLTWSVQFDSAAENAATLCSEPETASPLAADSESDSVPVLITGADAVSEYASVLSGTVDGRRLIELAAQAKPVARSA